MTSRYIQGEREPRPTGQPTRLATEPSPEKETGEDAPLTPFDVQCTTCKANLIVKRQQAVGNIFRCPHCGGMVLAVQAPPQPAKVDLKETSTSNPPARTSGSRWRGGAAVVGKASRLKSRRPKRLLESSYDVVHDLLDQPPVNGDQHDSRPIQPVTAHEPVAEVEDRTDSAERTRVPRRPRRRIRELLLSVITGVLLTSLFFFWHRSHQANTSQAGMLTLRPTSQSMKSPPIDLRPRLAAPPAGLPQSCSFRQLLVALSSQLGVPVTLDADSFRFRSALLTSTLRVPTKADCIERAANEALRPLKLMLSSQDGHAVVCGRPSAIRQATHDVSDLARDAAQQEQMTGFLRQFVAPDTWDNKDCRLRFEDNVLAVHNTESVHLQILQFCEQLRAARGLPPRSRATAGDGLASIWDRAQHSLSMPVNFECDGPTPLVDVLANLEKTAGCFILVDWKSLAESGFTNEPLVTLNVREVPLRDAIRHIARQLGLTVRTLDPTCCQLTTSESENCRSRVAFYRLDPRLDFRQLAKLLGQKLALPAADTNRYFGHDEISGTLVAFLPESQHQAVASVLNAAADVN